MRSVQTIQRVVQGLVSRWVRPEIARFVSVVVLVMAVLLTAVLFVGHGMGRITLGPQLGADYAQFYAIGTLLNEHGPKHLYDLEIQDRILHRVMPTMPPGEHLPYVYPPFVAPLFRPLALLPYTGSFAVWLVLSASIYITGLALLFRGLDALTSEDRITAWLLALSTGCFVFECWMGGQLSVVGCLAIIIGLRLFQSGFAMAAGLAFSLLLYKPSLILMLLSLLVVGRRWSVLSGFAGGAAILAASSLAVAGWEGCLDFIDLMRGYSSRGGSGAAGFRTIKYVDLKAFFQLLGLTTTAARLVALVVAIPPLAALIALWHRMSLRPKADLDLTWSATLCWLPVLNVYGPVYDATLVIPGILLAANTFRRQIRARLPQGFIRLLALLYLSSLTTSPLVISTGVQCLTLALVAMGTYLLVIGHRISASPCPVKPLGPMASHSGRNGGQGA